MLILPSPSVIMLTVFGNMFFFFLSSFIRFFLILSRASLINFFLFSISSFVFEEGSSMLLINFGRLSKSSKVLAPTSLGGWIDCGGKMSLNEVGFNEDVKILKMKNYEYFHGDLREYECH